ncbi:GGDEF domain-containing protein [Actinoplanes sp. NPDC026619]|uniref:GGDEF domain-containing protein n=1 Tax=Actinoplanes sp. NPDC026619 TaxID=3155798 RepID=UPI0033D4F43A
MFITGVVLTDTRTASVVTVFGILTVVLTLGGVVCRRRPDRLPRVTWLLAPFFGAAMVSILNLFTSDASIGAQFYYLWPVLYSANFLGRVANYLVLATVSAGSAMVLFPVEGANQGLSDWTSLTVAMIVTAIVVSSLRLRNDRLREVLETQAYADPLTGVANRRAFDGELARAVAWANRSSVPIALMTIDIDYFKKINDTWGHAIGDMALQAVADALRSVARREDDVVGRLGGDEFVVLLRMDRMEARRAADEIRAAAAAIDSLPGGPPGLSIGVAVLPDHAGNAGELAAASDAALYEAKQGGRGRTAMAHPPTSTSIAV